MSDDHPCPTSHCRRPMRRGDVVCRRCWYVLPDDLKAAYRDALAELRASKNHRNIQAILAAKQRIIHSLNPRGTTT